MELVLGVRHVTGVRCVYPSPKNGCQFFGQLLTFSGDDEAIHDSVCYDLRLGINPRLEFLEFQPDSM